jgi:hypothetical protein
MRLNFQIIKNSFNKFLITPHILTEVCNHLRNDHGKRKDQREIFAEISPFLSDLVEKDVSKEQILKKVIPDKAIEIGYLSIFVIADEFIKENKKISILSKDRVLNSGYKDHPDVMVMDFENIIYNLA